MKRTIMICDDTMFMRSVIARTVSEAGYEVIGEAATATEAVDRYHVLKPNIVTMDVVMPGGGGIEALRAITKSDPSACIVMCSAMGQTPLMQQVREAGARGFILKPFQPADLLGELERALASAPAAATEGA